MASLVDMLSQRCNMMCETSQAYFSHKRCETKFRTEDLGMRLMHWQPTWLPAASSNKPPRLCSKQTIASTSLAL